MGAALSRRQRTAPPFDRWNARRGLGRGGVDTANPRTLAPGMESELSRYPGASNDSETVRARGPWMHKGHVMPAGQSWKSWSADGPARPELHMENETWRTESGSSRSRFPGLHTNVPNATSRTLPRYVDTPQMRPARQDRLRPGQYSGQTYSQTTQIQGERGRR